MEVLDVNTENKFSFNSRKKSWSNGQIAVQMLRDFSEHRPAHVDNDRKRISLAVSSKKSKNVKLESKDSS